MKLLFMITILLQLGSLRSSSQTVMVQDSNAVKILKPIAIRIAQDLLRYDGLKNRADLLEQKIGVYEGIVIEKDSTITDQRQTISRMNMMISNQDAIKKEIDLRLQQSEKQIRKQKTLKWLAIIGGVVSSGTAIYLLK